MGDIIVLASCELWFIRCRIYMDILTGEKLLSILVANIDVIYWSVRSSIRRGGVEVKGADIIILASCELRFIKEHKYLGRGWGKGMGMGDIIILASYEKN